MSTVHVIDHPLVQHKLTFLRDKNTEMCIRDRLCAGGKRCPGAVRHGCA